MVGENGFMTAGYVDAGLKLVETLGLYLILVSFTSSRAVPLSVFVFQATRCYSPFLSLSLSLLSVSPHDEDPAAVDAPWRFGWSRLTSPASRRPLGWNASSGLDLSLLQCSLYVPTDFTPSCFVLVLIRG